MVPVSFVIPTYQRHELLDRLLASLQTEVHLDDEIIIIDDHSSEAVKELNLPCQVHVYRNEENVGPATSRNRGAAYAKHDIVVFIDDDCMIEPGYRKALEQALPTLHGLGYGRICYEKRNARFPERIVASDHTWPMGAHLICQKSLLTQLGGFDPTYASYHNEDTEIALRALSRGIALTPIDLAVIHQSTIWTAKPLWRSRINLSVWPLLKKTYPEHWKSLFKKKPKIILFPERLLGVALLPLFPLFLVMFLCYDRKNYRYIHLFAIKLLLLPVAERICLIRNALKERVFLL